jgi:hypothetical protein
MRIDEAAGPQPEKGDVPFSEWGPLKREEMAEQIENGEKLIFNAYFRAFGADALKRMVKYHLGEAEGYLQGI